MNHDQPWVWAALFLLGAYHGMNPGMGWLFAVALGMQRHSARVVWGSLVPIAAGHALSIGLVVAGAITLGVVLPQRSVQMAVALLLLALGLYRLLRRRHPHWGGMQVGFRDLTFWSFLMATAHGAGLMLLPLLLGMSTIRYVHHDMHLHTLMMSGGPWLGAAAVGTHAGISTRYRCHCICGVRKSRVELTANCVGESRSGVGRGAHCNRRSRARGAHIVSRH